MIDRYAPAQAQRPKISAPELPDGFEPRAPELTPLHFNRDERLAAERNAA
jgi:hypothetical protein